MACICDDLNNIDIRTNSPHANIDDVTKQIESRCQCVGVVESGVNPKDNNLLKEAFKNKPLNCCDIYVVFSENGNMWTSIDGINWCQGCGTEVAINDTCTLIVSKDTNINQFNSLISQIPNSSNCTSYTIIYEDNSVIFKREANDAKWHVVYTRLPFRASMQVSENNLPSSITSTGNYNFKFDEIIENELDLIQPNPLLLVNDWGNYYIKFDYDGYAMVELSVVGIGNNAGDLYHFKGNMLISVETSSPISNNFRAMVTSYISGNAASSGDTGTSILKVGEGDYLRFQFGIDQLTHVAGVDVTSIVARVLFYPY